MVFCCACGLDIGGIRYPETFDLDEEEIAQLYNEEELPESQVQWTQSGFATLDEKSFNLGNMDPFEGSNFTSLRGEKFTVKNAKPGFEQDWQLLPDITEPESFFPIHTTCLSIVEYLISQKSDHSITGLAAIKTFYRTLDGLRESVKEDWHNAIGGKGIRWKHGYYGAQRFWLDLDGPEWTMERGWEFLCADPFNIPGLTDYLLSNLKTTPIQPQSQSAVTSQEDSKSPTAALDNLSVELLDQITSHLPCSTILSLHRTNRALSVRISLDPSFWRDQLISGSLIPFIWDLDATKCLEKEGTASAATFWDWRLLANTLKAEPFVDVALRKSLSGPLCEYNVRDHLDFWRDLSKDAESRLNRGPPLGLVNRVRIVRIIEEAIIQGRG